MSSLPMPATTFVAPREWRLVVAFIALNLVLLGFGGDLWIADRIYALEGHAWRLQDGFITQAVLHVGGRRFSALAWLLVVVGFGASFVHPPLRAWRSALGKLALSVLLSTSLVALLKNWTHVACPWDLVRYGGGQPEGLGVGRCFPAGHASAGYAWMALYFFFLAVRPAWRWHGLALGLVLGLVFGVDQQLRGAHFLSHDLWAAAICWTTALLVDRTLPR